MKTNILIGSQELSRALRRYLVYVKGHKSGNFNILMLTDNIALSHDILKANFWIIEAWQPFENRNPAGFRTAYKLAGRSKFLLFFYDIPDGFPEDGSFWCNPIICNLSNKISDVIGNPPPTKADFERLIELWPALGHYPKTHHHPRARKRE